MKIVYKKFKDINDNLFYFFTLFFNLEFQKVVLQVFFEDVLFIKDLIINQISFV